MPIIIQAIIDPAFYYQKAMRPVIHVRALRSYIFWFIFWIFESVHVPSPSDESKIQLF